MHTISMELLSRRTLLHRSIHHMALASRLAKHSVDLKIPLASVISSVIKTDTNIRSIHTCRPTNAYHGLGTQKPQTDLPGLYSQFCKTGTGIGHRLRYCTMADTTGPVLFRQLFEHKSCTYTYLLACKKTKEAALIDPVIEMVPRDVKLLTQLGYTLKYALNTHVHADHITGSGQLKQQLTGSKSVLGVDSGAKADIYLDQGQTLKIGEIELEARKTPGHTNGCMSYIWHDQKRVFSGDAVLIRGCGRTDFQQGDADRLYTSVHTQIFSLPDDYAIFPAHDYTGQPWTTVGEEKTHNPRLSKDRAAFVELMAKLNLPYPKQIDLALPANLVCGITGDIPEGSTK